MTRADTITAFEDAERAGSEDAVRGHGMVQLPRVDQHIVECYLRGYYNALTQVERDYAVAVERVHHRGAAPEGRERADKERSAAVP